MDVRAAMEHHARVLDRAEGVLIALRHCSTDAAFEAMANASKRHHVPMLGIAAALVALAQNSPFDDDAAAAAAARCEWGPLLEHVSRA
jgi:hypothetical protein